VALGAAVDWITDLGLDTIHAYEQTLVEHALEVLPRVDGLRILGPATAVDRGPTIAFTLDGVHPHDVAQLLDERGIAVRAGHHCARPVCVRYGVPATTRASFAAYTTIGEIDALAQGLSAVVEMFR
jgi:cysteine desulfurase/selenocysteine lyase